MTEIDALAGTLLEESKRFLEKASEAGEGIARHAYLHASLSLGFSALEAHINSIVDEQSQRSDLSLHERAFLLEKKVDLRKGTFMLLDSLQMQRVEDRIDLLWTRCSTNPPFDYQNAAWGQLKEGLRLRNALTHPKEHTELTIEQVSRSVGAMLEIIDILFQRIYGKPFPSKGRGLQSTLEF